MKKDWQDQEQRPTKAKLFAGIATLASVAATTTVVAQETGSPLLEEIIVTSTRKSEALSRVAASVAAKSQIELDEQGVRSMNDLAKVTPGISFGQTNLAKGTGQYTISIRGVDSLSGVPTTGIYIDDTPVQTRVGVSPSLSNAYPRIFDLERVEVLRGPQGTLFGSGSVGGAVRFIMPGPEYSEPSLYSRSEVASTKHGGQSYETGVAGGAPLIVDKLGFRGSVSYRRDGGYIDRLHRYTGELRQKDIDSADAVTARLAVGMRLTDKFTVTPSIFFQREELDDTSRFELATSNRSAGNLRTSLEELPESHQNEFYLPALKMELDFGGLTLISDTSYFKRDSTTQSDDTTLSYAFSAGLTEGPFLAGFENYTPRTDNMTQQELFTQELRLQNNSSSDRFNWITGFFFQDSRVEDEFRGVDARLLDVINVGQSRAGEPPFPSLTDSFFGVELIDGQYSLVQRTRHDDRQMALYAQADYEIVPRLKLIAGLRYTIADYEFTGFGAGPVLSSAGRTDTADVTTRDLTPKVGVAFQADSNNLFYASAAKGVRGPGVSPPVGIFCAEDAAAIGFDPLATLTVDPDSVWTYEIGSKNRLFDGALAIDASAYRTEWKDVQTLFALPICTIYTTLNLGAARIEGFDLAFNVQPLEGLLLGAAVAYTDANYTTDIVGPGNSIIRRAGEPFPVAPWMFKVNGEFNYPVGSSNFYARADYAYSSHNSTPIDVDSPLVDPNLPRAPSTSQLDLRFGLRFDAIQHSDLDISLFVNNVTNSLPLTSLSHETPASTWYTSTTFRPRTIGVTATLRR